MCARSYIAKIRNKAKRAYAEAFWFSLVNSASREPNHSDYALSYMAAQAVRMNLRDLFENVGAP